MSYRADDNGPRAPKPSCRCKKCGAYQWSGPLFEGTHYGGHVDSGGHRRRFVSYSTDACDRDWLRWTCSCGSATWTRPLDYEADNVVPIKGVGCEKR